jgi:hypothetical protein
MRVYRDVQDGGILRTKELLSVEVWIARSGRIERFRAVGEVTNMTRRRQIVNEVNAHRGWSDQQVLALLRSRGATATPDQMDDPQSAFQEKVKDLEYLFGAMNVNSVECTIRDPNQFKAGLPSAELLWTVIVETLPADLTPSRYAFIYEPFEGRLIDVQGVGP